MLIHDAVGKFKDSNFSNITASGKIKIDIKSFEKEFDSYIYARELYEERKCVYCNDEKKKDVHEENAFFRNKNSYVINFEAKGVFGEGEDLSDAEAAYWNGEINTEYCETIWITTGSLGMSYAIFTSNDEIDYDLLNKIGTKFYRDLFDICEKTKEYIQRCPKKKSNGGCYITTAVCRSLGVTDTCYELESFRRFRDTWLNIQPDGEKLIQKYYGYAPQIVHAIDQKDDAGLIYRQIWSRHLKPCLKCIENHDMEKCKTLYMQMVKQLGCKFLGNSI